MQKKYKFDWLNFKPLGPLGPKIDMFQFSYFFRDCSLAFPLYFCINVSDFHCTQEICSTLVFCKGISGPTKNAKC